MLLNFFKEAAENMKFKHCAVTHLSAETKDIYRKILIKMIISVKFLEFYYLHVTRCVFPVCDFKGHT